MEEEIDHLFVTYKLNITCSEMTQESNGTEIKNKFLVVNLIKCAFLPVSQFSS